jgi:hypothetical protein
MKKILIFLIVLGAITFINIDLFAYTFNGSYDFSNVDLNASLTELNGASLNDLFDYDYYTDIYLGELPSGHRNKFVLDNGLVKFKQEVKRYDLPILDIHTFNTTLKSNFDFIQFYKPNDLANITSQEIMKIEGSYNFTPSSTLFVNNDVNFVYTWSSGISGASITLGLPKGLYNDITEVRNVYSTKTIYYLTDTPIYDTHLDQTLYYYNLENINIDLLNYYFAVWILNTFDLAIGDLWSYAYNAGFSNGYDQGNLQGYSDGYDEGLYDYHTGNYYGDYDYTLSEPYDQATQANISLLSVFSLVIGVVMSMLGFIINIEMFGISIASVLGTLAIGVSIVWLLKLIRG